jgi:hypothetical protein
MARATGHIHAAPLSSPRLQRVLRVLDGGRPQSTRAIVRKAQVVAVNAVIAELRQHGATITCVRRQRPNGRGFYHLYTMTKAPVT